MITTTTDHQLVVNMLEALIRYRIHKEMHMMLKTISNHPLI